jgi:hypothetical protein
MHLDLFILVPVTHFLQTENRFWFVLSSLQVGAARTLFRALYVRRDTDDKALLKQHRFQRPEVKRIDNGRRGQGQPDALYGGRSHAGLMQRSAMPGVVQLTVRKDRFHASFTIAVPTTHDTQR